MMSLKRSVFDLFDDYVEKIWLLIKLSLQKSQCIKWIVKNLCDVRSANAVWKLIMIWYDVELLIKQFVSFERMRNLVLPTCCILGSQAGISLSICIRLSSLRTKFGSPQGRTSLVTLIHTPFRERFSPGTQFYSSYIIYNWSSRWAALTKKKS